MSSRSLFASQRKFYSPSHIVFLTDVEGDMAYFQRWVAQSKIICWEDRKTGASCSSSPSRLSYADLDDVRLGFVNAPDMGASDPIGSSKRRVSPHFVFGGDAFDHGWDLTFCRALLDFKARFPDRVHLILGNRDLNKMVMRHIFDSTGDRAPSTEVEVSRSPQLLTGAEVSAAPPPGYSLSFGVAGHRNPQAAEDALFPSRSGPPAKVSYQSYLESVYPDVDKSALQAHPTTFLQWALKHRLGSPNAFENRRRELHAIRLRVQAKEGVSTPAVDLPTDEEVARSYAAAIEPGGVYYEYLRAGQLLLHIGPVLCVHGGIGDDNLGRLPSINAPYNSPTIDLKRLLPVGAQEAEVTGHTFHSWLDSLHQFKQDGFHAFDRWVDHKGEALRRYGNQFFCTRYSVTVNSPLQSPTGPINFSLPVVQQLVEEGIQFLLIGHMPAGDTPVLIRPHPLGSLTCLAGDNSYCGRGNAFSTTENPRGKAIQEIILYTQPPVALHEHDEASEEEEEPLVVRIHGNRADGTPFDFIIDRDEPYLGRCLVRQSAASDSDSGEKATLDYWWVKRRGITLPPPAPSEEHYALHCTRNSFYSEEELEVPLSEMEKLFSAHSTDGDGHQDKGDTRFNGFQPPPPVGGTLLDTETAESLRNIPVHRIKTKVVSSTPSA